MPILQRRAGATPCISTSARTFRPRRTRPRKEEEDEDEVSRWFRCRSPVYIDAVSLDFHPQPPTKPFVSLLVFQRITRTSACPKRRAPCHHLRIRLHAVLVFIRKGGGMRESFVLAFEPSPLSPPRWDLNFALFSFDFERIICSKELVERGRCNGPIKSLVNMEIYDQIYIRVFRTVRVVFCTAAFA